MSQSFVSIAAEHADVLSVETDDGLTLRLYRLHGRRDERLRLPLLLFGHACGFAAGSYLPFLSSLADVADVFAFDARGHGGSAAPVGDPSLYTPDHYARDLVTIARAVGARSGGRPIAYVGHSLGAAAMLRLGSLHPQAWRQILWQSLLLLEPPIFPSADRPEHAEALAKDRDLVRRTLARRARWPSREAFVDAVAGRGGLREMRHEFLVAHAAAAMRPAADGDGYELCCPPRLEAATYKGFGDDSTYRALPRFPSAVPLHLVGGDASDAHRRSWVTLIAPVLAARLGLEGMRRGPRTFTALAERGHLMIQQDPQMTRQLVYDSLATAWNP